MQGVSHGLPGRTGCAARRRSGKKEQTGRNGGYVPDKLNNTRASAWAWGHGRPACWHRPLALLILAGHSRPSFEVNKIKWVGKVPAGHEGWQHRHFPPPSAAPFPSAGATFRGRFYSRHGEKHSLRLPGDVNTTPPPPRPRTNPGKVYPEKHLFTSKNIEAQYLDITENVSICPGVVVICLDFSKMKLWTFSFPPPRN